MKGADYKSEFSTYFNYSCHFLLLWEDSHLKLYTPLQISYPLTFFPLQQLAEWPCWLLFSLLAGSTSPHMQGWHTFIEQCSRKGVQQEVTAVCVTLSTASPVSLHSVCILFLECGGAVRAWPAVLYGSHTCTGQGADQSASLSDLKKIICYRSSFVSNGAQPASGILGLPTQYFTV